MYPQFAVFFIFVKLDRYFENDESYNYYRYITLCKKEFFFFYRAIVIGDRGDTR